MAEAAMMEPYGLGRASGAPAVPTGWTIPLPSAADAAWPLAGELAGAAARLASRAALSPEKVDLGVVTVTQDCTGLRRSDGGVTIILCLDGCFEARVDAARIAMTPGRMLLARRHRPDAAALGSARTIGLWFDCQAAHALLCPDGEVALRERSPCDPAFAFLAAYCAQLSAFTADMPAALARLAGRHLGDMAAHLLEPPGPPCAAPFGGPTAARLRAVLDHMAAHLGDPGLSAGQVGARLGLSPRRVQQMLESVGLSFSTHVRQMRLDEAHRLLADPGNDHMRVADIAYAAGFRDLSYFNREFRRRFGENPTGVRSDASAARFSAARAVG